MTRPRTRGSRLPLELSSLLLCVEVVCASEWCVARERGKEREKQDDVLAY